MTFSAMIENVTHGRRRTVEFSFPIGINEPTRNRNRMINIRIISDMAFEP
jgi:small-conductance mechanosensitive channel